MLWGIRVAVVVCALATAAAAQAAPPDSSGLPDAPSRAQRRQIGPAAPFARQSLTVPEGGPYLPLTTHEKFHHFVHHAYSPYTIVGAMYDATYAQAVGDPWEYGGGMPGWGKRFGAAMAGTETRGFLGTFLFPTLFHQDPRYFAMYHGPLLKRAFHAAGRVLIIHADDGHRTFNSSGLLTIAFTQALSTAWTPEGQRTVGVTFSRMAGAVQGDATSYLLREFTPDLQRLFRRFAPKKVKQIEQKIPPQITGMPREE